VLRSLDDKQDSPFSYTLQISQDSDFKVIAQTKTVTPQADDYLAESVFANLSPGLWYWRARAEY